MSSDEQRPEQAEDEAAAESSEDRGPEPTDDTESTEESVSTESAEDSTGSGDADGTEDIDGTEDTEGATEDGESGAARGDRLPRRLVFAAGALAVAALVTAGVFGVQWWTAAADDNIDLAQAREEVIRVGSSAVKAFTELDYNKPDQFFDRSIAVSTDELAEQIDNAREANKKQMLEAKTVANTTVLDLAVDELNNHEGKARFLAAIQVEVKKGDQTSVKPMRVEVEMTRVDEDGDQAWKVSGISQVPVIGAGQ
ncbi:hypothetical protein [Amycolatopsis cihanbeyliensis]|uniref:Mce-associated membrane protein n=1 Tax=Amycolatopsis cihanbeyliensis TaxID=1128664 RepID=A0A542DJF0_AMYCI|nr:hypothetical protein [Amycolatopsis cihanbeyliensis]TQJ03222.1 Mce-associated membrane protein [Amycolatopsis cihanbeyliensis]